MSRKSLLVVFVAGALIFYLFYLNNYSLQATKDFVLNHIQQGWNWLKSLPYIGPYVSPGTFIGIGVTSTLAVVKKFWGRIKKGWEENTIKKLESAFVAKENELNNDWSHKLTIMSDERLAWEKTAQVLDVQLKDREKKLLDLQTSKDQEIQQVLAQKNEEIALYKKRIEVLTAEIKHTIE